MQSPIENYFIYFSIGGNSEKQLMPKILLNVFVGELHNSIVSPPEEGRLKEARYFKNIIIISYSSLFNILPS